jgi:hypothetical protein
MRWKTLILSALLLILTVPCLAAPQILVTEGIYIMGDGETPAQAEKKHSYRQNVLQLNRPARTLKVIVRPKTGNLLTIR